MEEPSAEGLLVAGGATEVEGAASGSQGRSIRDGEGEAATPRKNLSVSSSLPRRNLRKEFRTPQVIDLTPCTRAWRFGVWRSMMSGKKIGTHFVLGDCFLAQVSTDQRGRLMMTTERLN